MFFITYCLQNKIISRGTLILKLEVKYLSLSDPHVYFKHIILFDIFHTHIVFVGAVNDVAFPEGCPDLIVTSSKGEKEEYHVNCCSIVQYDVRAVREWKLGEYKIRNNIMSNEIESV